MAEQELSLDEMRMVISSICADYDAYLDVEGGELFIREEIPELLRMLTEDERRRITITTNGTLYPPIQAELLRSLDEFRVSVEGHTDELHRLLRGIPLTAVLSNCLRWQEQGITVVIRMTLHKANYRQLHAMLPDLLQQGFRDFSFYFFQPVGRGNEFADQFELDGNELHTLIHEISILPVRYPDLNKIKLQLPAGRQDIVMGLRNEWEENDFIIEDLSKIPTVTVNYEGSVGTCPWMISRDSPEGWNLRITPLADLLRMAWEQQPVRHECEHCSDIRLKYESNRWYCESTKRI